MESRVSTLPIGPGVYIFKDANNTILYIGKAKSIRKRVSSYFKKNNTDWKIHALLQEHATIDYIITKNETAALLLEAQLIKDHKPKYNVLLKAGYPFLYILFTHEDLPHIQLVRHKKQKGTYFGPFLHKAQTRSAFRYLMQTFRLTLCNKTIANGCLDYHLGLCAGNCKPDFNSADYLIRLQLAQDALNSNSAAFLKTIKASIGEYNQRLEFEKSKHLTEYLLNFDTIFTTLKTRFKMATFHDAIMAITAPKHHVSALAQQGGPALQELVGSANSIATIDCFDISHFQGKFLVGSCVRFTNGVPDKNKFRRFTIKSLTEQNDYAALQEIVARRYKDPDELPDLILIDGGKGQRNAVLPLVGSTLCVSLAKREERLFTPLHPDGIPLDIRTAVGQLLIALRDYAHHFAISYHRLKRRKAVGE
ncbi:MAG: GIY-YIG nuclease family protein [Candidatus Babeliales bacterium]